MLHNWLIAHWGDCLYGVYRRGGAGEGCLQVVKGLQASVQVPDSVAVQVQDGGLKPIIVFNCDCCLLSPATTDQNSADTQTSTRWEKWKNREYSKEKKKISKLVCDLKS